MITQSVRDQLFRNPDVTSVGWGYRYIGGVRTPKTCVIVGVRRKLQPRDVRTGRTVPRSVHGLLTDVQSRDIHVLPPEPLAYTQHRRPCPPGYSIGHYKISAGTLGAYVQVGGVDGWVILSNNHVLANSNDAQPNDRIIQPGKADGGFGDADRGALLKRFAIIKWDGDNTGGCNLFKRATAWWHRARAVEQPHPNLIDAAIAAPVNQGWVELRYPDGSMVSGMKDLELGELVKKTGRTSERTLGMVEGVNTMVQVQYGMGQVATYADQVEIRADNGEFSASGDSGSAILTMENKLGGLLFAGGSGVTIANNIKHVVDILGVGL